MPDTPHGQILIYQDGPTALRVRLDGTTVWLTQAQIAELYQTTSQNVTQHIKDIYDDGELPESATCKDYLQVRREGSRDVQRSLKHYSLDVVLAVGYRVRSDQGRRFRQWATVQLRDLLVKGFVLDDERLASGRSIGADYFEELLTRIRTIRASERRFYQKVADIYATSIDYDPNMPTTQDFFATVQNKLHWAIHGQTAAEVIATRVDPTKPNLGLTTWKGSPHAAIRRADVTVAKNYLSQDELTQLDRIVGMYLDYAEDQARRKRPMHMHDWAEKLDAFLGFNERDILNHAGKISHAIAEKLAGDAFDQYANQQRIAADTRDSDFDQAVKRLTQNKKHKVPPNKPPKVSDDKDTP
jgi:hypothetical protein